MFKFTSWLQKSEPKESLEEQQEDDKTNLKLQTPSLNRNVQAPQSIHLSSISIASQPQECFPDPLKHGTVTWSTLLSSNLTPTNSLTAGLATCKPGTFLAHHRHAQAEIYFIVEGEGIVTIDGEEKKVSKGDLVYIPGNAEHGVRSTGEEEDLKWLYCFAADSFEEIEYSFSGISRDT